MKLKVYIQIASMIFLAVSYSCTHKIEIDEPILTDTECDSNKVYFVNDIQPILNSSCAYSGCHDAASQQDGVDLSSYSRIMATADVRPGNPDGSDLYEVLEDGEMPPAPNNPLSNEQKQMIYNWIKQGALNNQCISDCDTSNVTFSKNIITITDSYCKGCHSGASPDAGISITNFAEIQTLAADGRLLGVIEHKQGYSPMPKNQNQLSDCQIETIKIWINDGMPNN
jgi:uncharacterized membrane protein